MHSLKQDFCSRGTSSTAPSLPCCFASHPTSHTPLSLPPSLPPCAQAHCCIGGKSIGDDIRRLEGGVHIVSGTPGRVFDMIKRRSLRTR